MKSQKKSFLVDTNLFISAFKSGETKSTELFIKLIKDDEIELVANEILLKEYEKYAENLGPKSKKFFTILSENCKMIKPTKEEIRECEEYFEDSQADVIHAASCLRQESILLTNDKDFDDIKESGPIEVWGISKAIKNIL